MENSLCKEVNKWGETITNYKFPRWEQLPDIGYYMDQVIEFTEQHLSIFSGEDSLKLISPSIINNYVKLKIIPPPVKKRYSKEHIALLLMICILKPVIPIASIQKLIELQTRDNPLSDVYNRFCVEQEMLFNKTISLANNDISSIAESTNSNEEMLSVLAIRMAIMSNSAKLIADKIMSINKNNEIEEK